MYTNHRSSTNSLPKFSFRVKTFLKPRMLLIGALLLCWELKNSMAVSFYPARNGHQNHMHRYHQSGGVRLRAPPSLNQLSSYKALQPLGGADLKHTDEAALANTVSRSPSAITPYSYSSALETQMNEALSGPRRKKDCGEPSIATRGLLGPTLKRSYFAYTQDEMDQKLRDDEYRESVERRKRDVQQELFQNNKRNGGTGVVEAQESALPWTCETKYEWKDMGADHYPRFVRTAECKSRLCFNGFFRCRPRRYKTKVLKRVTPADSTSCEDDDVSLPETLRANWKFITVTINLCCDCTGRIPGNTEV